MSDSAVDTTSALQQFINLGAVVVFKTKTTLAFGERPTTEYVDQLAFFNPCGEGYQHPQGTSCGTGAGMAFYDCASAYAVKWTVWDEDH